MKKFKIVFDFEFRSLFLKKSVIVSTLVIAIVAFAITFIPRFLPTGDVIDDSSSVVTLIFDDSYGLYFASDDIKEVYTEMLGNATIFTSEEALKEAVMEQTITTGVAFSSVSSYTEYQFDTSLMTSSITNSIVSAVNFDINLQSQGIDPSVVYNIMNIPIDSNTVILGTDGTQGVAFVYMFIFITYFLILLYGSSVSTSVAREKDSRTMELLITSTNPQVLIFGKVFAAGIVGCLQLAFIILSGVLGVLINYNMIPDFILALIGGNMSIDTLAVFIVFSVSGYLLYLFIFAALGSLVSKVEDVSSAIQPVMMLFIAAYFIAMMAFNMPDAGFVRISSYIPFTSLFTMPIRYMLTTVGLFELLSSLVIILVVTYLIARISVYIYRFGSLNYGNKIKLKEVIKAWRHGA